MNDQEEARAFIRDMEDRYDFSSGAIGTGKTILIPRPTEKELESLAEFGDSCPKCGRGIFIKYQDNSVAHTIILICKHCDFKKNITDFDSW